MKPKINLGKSHTKQSENPIDESGDIFYDYKDYLGPTKLFSHDECQAKYDKLKTALEYYASREDCGDVARKVLGEIE